jgi:hypothetical protein
MFSHTTAQHIYCTNTVQTVQSTAELYLTVITHSCCCYMFSCTTAQHIYCTNTVQTVQSTAELYLTVITHSCCCYMFSCTTADKLSSLMSSEVGSSRLFGIVLYIDSNIRSLDSAKKFRRLKTHCHNFTALPSHATAKRLTLRPHPSG